MGGGRFIEAHATVWPSRLSFFLSFSRSFKVLFTLTLSCFVFVGWPSYCHFISPGSDKVRNQKSEPVGPVNFNSFFFGWFFFSGFGRSPHPGLIEHSFRLVCFVLVCVCVCAVFTVWEQRVGRTRNNYLVTQCSAERQMNEQVLQTGRCWTTKTNEKVCPTRDHFAGQTLRPLDWIVSCWSLFLCVTEEKTKKYQNQKIRKIKSNRKWRRKKERKKTKRDKWAGLQHTAVTAHLTGNKVGRLNLPVIINFFIFLLYTRNESHNQLFFALMSESNTLRKQELLNLTDKWPYIFRPSGFAGRVSTYLQIFVCVCVCVFRMYRWRKKRRLRVWKWHTGGR